MSLRDAKLPSLADKLYGSEKVEVEVKEKGREVIKKKPVKQHGKHSKK